MTDFDKAIDEAKKAFMPFESWERLAKDKRGNRGGVCGVLRLP